MGGFTNYIIGRGLMKRQSWFQHKSWNTHMNQWNATLHIADVLALTRRYLPACTYVRESLCPSCRLSTVFSSLILCLSVCRAICVYFPFMATCLAACTSPPPPPPTPKKTYYMQQKDSCLYIPTQQIVWECVWCVCVLHSPH